MPAWVYLLIERRFMVPAHWDLDPALGPVPRTHIGMKPNESVLAADHFSAAFRKLRPMWLFRHRPHGMAKRTLGTSREGVRDGGDATFTTAKWAAPQALRCGRRDGDDGRARRAPGGAGIRGLLGAQREIGRASCRERV